MLCGVEPLCRCLYSVYNVGTVSDCLGLTLTNFDDRLFLFDCFLNSGPPLMPKGQAMHRSIYACSMVHPETNLSCPCLACRRPSEYSQRAAVSTSSRTLMNRCTPQPYDTHPSQTATSRLMATSPRRASSRLRSATTAHGTWQHTTTRHAQSLQNLGLHPTLITRGRVLTRPYVWRRSSLT